MAGQIIVIVSGKGGVGKTTSACNLATATANLGLCTGVLDADEQKSSDSFFRFRVAQEENKDLCKIECKYAIGDILDTIKAMSERTDVLFIDTAGFDSWEARQALSVADISISPYRPSKLDLQTSGRLSQTLRLAKANNHKLKCYSVLWQCSTHAKEKRSDIGRKILAHNAETETLKSKVTFREAWGDAWDLGWGVCEYDDVKSKAEVKSILEELGYADKCTG